MAYNVIRVAARLFIYSLGWKQEGKREDLYKPNDHHVTGWALACANWTFVVWGGLHGLYLCVEKFFKDITTKTTGPIKIKIVEPVVTKASVVPVTIGKKFSGFLYAMFTFFLVNVTWVFFRSSTFTKAWALLRSMFGYANDGSTPLLSTLAILKVSVIIAGMLVAHWFMRNTRVLNVAYKLPWWIVDLVNNFISIDFEPGKQQLIYLFSVLEYFLEEVT